MELTQNNISTIIAMLFPFISAIAIKYGVTLEETTTIAGISAIIELIILIWSAKHPNKLRIFGNQPTIQTQETVLNDEYEYGDQDGC